MGGERHHMILAISQLLPHYDGGSIPPALRNAMDSDPPLDDGRARRAIFAAHVDRGGAWMTGSWNNPDHILRGYLRPVALGAIACNRPEGALPPGNRMSMKACCNDSHLLPLVLPGRRGQ
jgi:hypothetical protein